jgi:IS5 family transposase
LNSKLHAVCDGEGRPLILLLSEGQMSDHKGARLVLDALPPASSLIADRGYDSAWFRQELTARGIEPCLPSSKSRKVPFAYDKALYCHATRSRTSLPSSRTGGASLPASIVAPTPSARPSASQPLSPSTSANES